MGCECPPPLTHRLSDGHTAQVAHRELLHHLALGRRELHCGTGQGRPRANTAVLRHPTPSPLKPLHPNAPPPPQPFPNSRPHTTTTTPPTHTPPPSVQPPAHTSPPCHTLEGDLHQPGGVHGEAISQCPGTSTFHHDLGRARGTGPHQLSHHSPQPLFTTWGHCTPQRPTSRLLPGDTGVGRVSPRNRPQSWLGRTRGSSPGSRPRAGWWRCSWRGSRSGRHGT